MSIVKVDYGKVGGGSYSIIARLSSYGNAYRSLIVYDTADVNNIQATLKSGTDSSDVVIGYTNTLPSGQNFPTLTSETVLNNCNINVDKSYSYIVIGTKAGAIYETYYTITIS